GSRSAAGPPRRSRRRRARPPRPARPPARYPDEPRKPRLAVCPRAVTLPSADQGNETETSLSTASRKYHGSITGWHGVVWAAGHVRLVRRGGPQNQDPSGRTGWPNRGWTPACWPRRAARWPATARAARPAGRGGRTRRAAMHHRIGWISSRRGVA